MSDSVRIALLAVAALLPFVLAFFSLAIIDEHQGTSSLKLRFGLVLLWMVSFALFAGLGADSDAYFHATGHTNEPLAAYWSLGGILTFLSSLGMGLVVIDPA